MFIGDVFIGQMMKATHEGVLCQASSTVVSDGMRGLLDDFSATANIQTTNV